MSSLFSTSLTLDSLAAYAQTAVTQVASQVEKRIDRVLDIPEQESSDTKSAPVRTTAPRKATTNTATSSTSTTTPTPPPPLPTNGSDETDSLGIRPLASPINNVKAPRPSPPPSMDDDLFASLPVSPTKTTTASPDSPTKTRARSGGPSGRGTKAPATTVPVVSHDGVRTPTPDPAIATLTTAMTSTPCPLPAVNSPTMVDVSPTVTVPLPAPTTLTTCHIGPETPAEVAVVQADLVPPMSPVVAAPVVTDSAPATGEISLLLERVAQRERQVLTLTQENSSLNDLIASMRSKVEEYEATKNATQTDLEELRQEFASRMADSEKRIQMLVKERETLRAQLQDGTSEMSSTMQERNAQLSERDEQIQQLLAEGEKLSKEQLKSATQIKKLKQSVKDTETKASTLQTQLDDALSKINQLQEEIRTAERYKESGMKLQQLGDTQAKRIAELELQLQDYKANEATLQANVQRAWNENSELRKANVESVAAAQSDALLKEIKKNEELHFKLEGTQREAEERESALRHEILDLRTTLTRAEDMAGWREDNLRQEIQNLQARLQASELRMEELRASAEDASKPLVRQIEAQQSQMLLNSKNWATIEQSLTSQVQKALEERNEALEKERMTSLRLMEVSTRMSSLETQLNVHREERGRLVTEAELARSKVEELERRLVDTESRLEAQRQSHVVALQENKSSFQALLRTQVQEERLLWERKTEDLERRLKEAHVLRDQVLAMSTATETQRTSSVVSSRKSTTDGLSSVLDLPRGALMANAHAADASLATSPLVDSMSNGGGSTAALIDRLTSSLKIKSAETESLTEQLGSLRTSRDELAEELLRMTRSMQQTEQTASRVPGLEAAIEELNKRYMATLELLGARTEEVEELRDDMKDVKAIFREQVTELLARLEGSSNGSSSSSTTTTNTSVV